jgi:hypothetical protein
MSGYPVGVARIERQCGEPRNSVTVGGFRGAVNPPFDVITARD